MSKSDGWVLWRHHGGTLAVLDDVNWMESSDRVPGDGEGVEGVEGECEGNGTLDGEQYAATGSANASTFASRLL